ncbi:hypothetical protein ACO0K2_08535 [Undibacterium sp. MH2W]|uniref:hypothetical protein n=1 Tax=Undibacterium sp. MH2W TaxID=3413044 RepID=UPI003BEFD6AC
MKFSIQGDDLWSAELRGMSRYSTLPLGYYPGIQGSRFTNPVKGGMSWTGAGRGCSKSTGWFVIDSMASDQYGTVSAIDLRFEQHCEGRTAALHGAIHWRAPSPLPPVVGNSTVGSWRAPSPLPTSGNYLYMQSDPGESLAKGRIDLQTNATAAFSVNVQDNRLAINVHGANDWNVNLTPQAGQSQFVAGDYANLSDGALTVLLGNYGQFSPHGWVVIDSISYAAGKIVTLDLRFEELGHNGVANDGGLLHGQLHWRADQPDNFPGPSTVVPALFWKPAAGNTPSSGSYIYLENDPSDYLTDQSSYLYTPLNSLIKVTSTDHSVTVEVNGDESWRGVFVGIGNMSQIQPGYYAGQGNSMRGNPSRGNFNWSGNGRGCNDAISGVVVDKAIYSGSQLIELRLRFEQHCENEPGAARGEIRWLASDVQQPAGPAAIPSGLWRAPTGSLPTSGSYLYIYSDQGDSIGRGKTVLMTDKDTKFAATLASLSNTDPYFALSAQSSNTDAGEWYGEFQTMIGLNKFQTGFYDHVARVPFQNRAFGGLSWGANGVSCDSSIGWFAVDNAVYVGEKLTVLHVRFAQQCDGYAPQLHGELHWEAPQTVAVSRQRNPFNHALIRKK